MRTRSCVHHHTRRSQWNARFPPHACASTSTHTSTPARCIFVRARRTECRFDLDGEWRVIGMCDQVTLPAISAGARAQDRRTGTKTLERQQRGSRIVAHARLKGLETLGQPCLKRKRRGLRSTMRSRSRWQCPRTSSSCTSAVEILRPRSRTSPSVCNRDGDANLALGGAFSSSQATEMLRRKPATETGLEWLRRRLRPGRARARAHLWCPAHPPHSSAALTPGALQWRP
jgi:hypothetical protein